MMKIAAAIYSLLLGGFALWAWVTYFLYEGSTKEHLLPGIILALVTVPSSLLIEGIIGLIPWILNSPIAMLSMLTGLGGVQVALVWLIAMR